MGPIPRLCRQPDVIDLAWGRGTTAEQGALIRLNMLRFLDIPMSVTENIFKTSRVRNDRLSKNVTKLKRLMPSISLKGKTILAIVLVGLLPLVLSLLLAYFEEQRALRESAGINFKGIAVELARKVETQITRGINEAQQLATIPFIRSAVIDSNRSYEAKNPDEIMAHIQEWQERWRQRAQKNEFPIFHQSICHELSDPMARRPKVGLLGNIGDRQPRGFSPQFVPSG